MTSHNHIPGAEHQTPGNQTTEHPEPMRLEGCTCIPVRGAHRPPCPWAASGQAPEAEAEAERLPALYDARWPYPEVTPAELVELYRAARVMIQVRMYDAYERDGYEDRAGICISTALAMAAEGFVRGRYMASDGPADVARAVGADAAAAAIEQAISLAARDLAEDAETRLAAVLYVLGQAHSRTGIRDLAGTVAAWELGHYSAPIRNVGQDHAEALLEHAAGIYAMIGATDGAAPVTIAPAP